MPYFVRRTAVAAAVCGWVLAGFVAMPRSVQAAKPTTSASENIAVQETFNGQPFQYQIKSKTSKDGFDIWYLNYPSPVKTDLPQNNIIPAEYYVPKGLKPGDAKRPAVICMHILGGKFELVRMMCSSLASHGVPAIMFKLPYYGERGPVEGPRVMANKAQLFVQALSQGMLDVRRTVDLLASRPEIDPKHIGIAGISLGGIVSATAAGMEPRIAKAMPILAGGDVAQILMTSRETVALRKAIDALSAPERTELDKALAAVDPLAHAADLKARAEAGNVLMVNATEDEIIPRQCTDKLADALGISDRVIWLEGLGHYSAIAALPRIMQTMVSFFAADIPAGAETAEQPATAESPLKTIAALLQQATMFMTVEPKADTCHSLDLEVKIPATKGKETTARVRYVRGTGSQFLLDADLPFIGQLMLGQGQYPWAAAKNKKVFKGSLDSEEVSGGPLRFVSPDYLIKIQVAAGTLAGIAMAPNIIEQAATIDDVTPAGGPRTLKIAAKDGQGTLEVTFAADGKTPKQISFEAKGIKGTAIIHGWQTNAPAAAEMFEPPHGSSVQEVEKGDLYRVFGAMLNFAMENLE